MLNLNEMADELNELVAWQETPTMLEHSDYLKIILRGVKRFFVDINHPNDFNLEYLTTDDDGNVFYAYNFNATEETYIMLLCKLEFFKRVQTDVNNTFGYSTDALTITNADKPYANLKNTVDDLEHERRIVFNKMVAYTLGE